MRLAFAMYTGKVIKMEQSECTSSIPDAASPTSSNSPTPLPQTPQRSFSPSQPSMPLKSSSIFHTNPPNLSSPKPIITLTDSNHLPASPNMAQANGSPPSPPPEKVVEPVKVTKIRSTSRKSSSKDTNRSSGEENPTSWMVYNEYGELVTLEQRAKPVIAEDLTVTQALRLVYKTYHAEVGHVCEVFYR